MSWNNDLRATLLTHKLLLSLVGIWPVKSRDYFTDLRWTLAAFSQIIPMMVHFMELYLHCHGMRASFDSLAPGAGATLALTRLIVPRIYRAKLYGLVSAVIDDWSLPQEDKTRAIMKKYSRMTVRVTELTSVLGSLIITLYLFFAIKTMFITKSKPEFQNSNESFLVIDSCVFNSANSEKAFKIVQAVQICITATVTVGTTSFFFGLVMHLCGQFDVIGDELLRNQSADARQIIARTAKRHSRLIDYVNDLENSFRITLLVSLFVTSLLLCVEGFLLILAVKDGIAGDIIHHTSVSLLMLFQLSFYTFAGDLLRSRSLNFSYLVYSHTWYELPRNAARDIQIILFRASMPAELTAGKIIPLDMVTFKDVLKSTASYLSVLRVFVDE